MTLTKDQWNDVPSVYFERPPQRKSHKKPTDQNVSDPRDCETGTKKRAIFFTLLFLGQQKIPDDCDLVGEPGDVWVTEGAVQVRTIAGWTDWKTRWTHDGGLSHPYLPADYKLTFQAALPSLGYNPARYPKTYQDWLRLTPDRLRECFDHYLGPDEAPLAAERALSLLALPSGKELKPYLEICGGGHHVPYISQTWFGLDHKRAE
ncbi:hypothetical protein PsYK624_073320 [Phanerochaete sordida]|uniref:Uncharacterized protein n=1 Tax=Phanerochaete sordida TaxID=48140 RepID=A0A9P3LE68_9APHY|nr:hypothetical protein PsYK624_073320 [Phanerochaete sordida]